VDEWKGKLGWFVYRMYKLCESSARYVWNFIRHIGSTAQYGDRSVDEPTTFRIFLELAGSLLDKGYIMYLENWYTSPNLLGKLRQRKMDCIGTMRLNTWVYQRK
jgi:hypothetical protein